MIIKSNLLLENELKWIYGAWYQPRTKERKTVEIMPEFRHVDSYYLQFSKHGKETRQIYSQTTRIEGPYNYMSSIFRGKDDTKVVLLVEDYIDCPEKVIKAIRAENSGLLKKNPEFMKFFNIVFSGIMKVSVIKISLTNRTLAYALILEMEAVQVQRIEHIPEEDKKPVNPESLLSNFLFGPLISRKKD